MEDFEQLMMFAPDEVFKASWKNQNYKKLDIKIERIPVAKQSTRLKTMPRGKGLGKRIDGELYYKVSDMIATAHPDAKITTETETVQWLLKAQTAGHKPFENEVIIAAITFIFEPIQSFNKAEKESINQGNFIPKTTKPDIDNLTKFLWDACNKILWTDDARISWINNTRKVYGKQPMTIIELYGR